MAALKAIWAIIAPEITHAQISLKKIVRNSPT